MKEKIKLFFKGFIMGIANIIPGLSGGTIALTLGIYEDFISSISNIFKNFKKSILYLLPILLGMGVSILSMSNVISFCFNKFAFPTTLLFMGLITGGLPLIFNKVKHKKVKISNIIIALITFSLVLLLAFSNEIFGSTYVSKTLSFNPISLLIVFIMGVIAASTMIIPGISGSLVLMLLGYYSTIINALKDLTHFNNIGLNLLNLFIFGIGVIVGIVAVSKLLEYLFKKHEVKTYYGVIGFIISSIIAIPVSVIHEYGNFSVGIIPIIIGYILFIVGTILGYKLGDE